MYLNYVITRKIGKRFIASLFVAKDGQDLEDLFADPQIETIRKMNSREAALVRVDKDNAGYMVRGCLHCG